MIKKTMHIGLDDTDSTRRGCTTYVAALLVEKLEKLGANFNDYPNLARLNPNVPWKTRGNGALCLRIMYDRDVEVKIEETVISTVEENSDLEWKGTDPGVVFFPKARIPRDVKAFAKAAITGVVGLGEALRLLRKHGAEAVGFKDGRGVIGGLAAVGATLEEDHTYEILAYRVPSNRGAKRKIDEASVFEMDEATAPYTFNNVDEERGRVIITPRGPDPILFGVRGESAGAVKAAFKLVRPLEPVERWVIFRTNQGTDAHLRRISSLKQARPYGSIIAKATVSTNPLMIRGRHVIFGIRDEDCQVDCAAYEPTGGLRKTAMKLMMGDSVEVYGAVKPPTEDRPLTINLEKIRVLKLAQKLAYQNPLCSKCGRRLNSMGRGQGFRCEKCGAKYPKLAKTAVAVKRDLNAGLYFTATRSQRHLSKPLRRYGLEKHRGSFSGLVEGWHFP
jgi:tRNA(Ile2)-agmatinylcytidine synthase